MEKESENPLLVRSPSKPLQGRPKMSETADHDAWKAGREPEAEASLVTRLTLNSSRVWDPGGVVEGN
jgi:hypothetical protein